MRTKVLTLGLAVLLILGMFALASYELLKFEWKDDGTASAIIINTSYDEVWEKTLDILLYGKFKIISGPSLHKAISIEKDIGLIVIKGTTIVPSITYTMKVTVRKEACNIMVECRSDGSRKNKVVKTFFRLLGKD